MCTSIGGTNSTRSYKRNHTLILFQIGYHADLFVKILQFGKLSFQCFDTHCEKLDLRLLQLYFLTRSAYIEGLFSHLDVVAKEDH